MRPLAFSPLPAACIARPWQLSPLPARGSRPYCAIDTDVILNHLNILISNVSTLALTEVHYYTCNSDFGLTAFSRLHVLFTPALAVAGVYEFLQEATPTLATRTRWRRNRLHQSCCNVRRVHMG